MRVKRQWIIKNPLEISVIWYDKDAGVWTH